MLRPKESEPSGFNSGKKNMHLGIPTVSLLVDDFKAFAIEMYELPSGIVLDMLAEQGPSQLGAMLEMLRLAMVDPKDVERLEELSFNQLTQVLYQWYNGSPVRVGRSLMPRVTLEDIVGPPEDERGNGSPS
jgi:hypothetical protein